MIFKQLFEPISSTYSLGVGRGPNQCDSARRPRSSRASQTTLQASVSPALKGTNSSSPNGKRWGIGVA